MNNEVDESEYGIKNKFYTVYTKINSNYDYKEKNHPRAEMFWNDERHDIRIDRLDILFSYDEYDDLKRIDAYMICTTPFSCISECQEYEFKLPEDILFNDEIMERHLVYTEYNNIDELTDFDQTFFRKEYCEKKPFKYSRGYSQTKIPLDKKFKCLKKCEYPTMGNRQYVFKVFVKTEKRQNGLTFNQVNNNFGDVNNDIQPNKQ